MKVIDLTQPLKNGMEIYSGDPEVDIKQIHTLKKEGWRLRLLKLGSHTGTHVDAFSHMDKKGTTIDKIPLNKFFGTAKVVKVGGNFPTRVGLVFKDGELDINLFQKIKKANPSFLVVGDKAELSVELERQLLKEKIITFTDLINLGKLPENELFKFFGVPLKIKDGDGSPIRAFAIID